MEKQRRMEIQTKETSACVNEADNEEICPLQLILKLLKPSVESFRLLAGSEDLHTFKTTSFSMDEEGKFNEGNLTIMCRFKPQRKLPFECGEISFRIFPTSEIEKNTR